VVPCTPQRHDKDPAAVFVIRVGSVGPAVAVNNIHKYIQKLYTKILH